MALRREKSQAVVSTGFCGGLDAESEGRRRFVASRIAERRPFVARRLGPAARAGVPLGCAGFESIAWSQTVEEKQRLRVRGASAVDMEAAAVAGMGRGIRSAVLLRACRDGPGGRRLCFRFQCFTGSGRAFQPCPDSEGGAGPAMGIAAGVDSPGAAGTHRRQGAWEIFLPIVDSDMAVPHTMRAAVYRGNSTVTVETVPTPKIGPRRVAGARRELRNLSHRPEEGGARPASAAAHFRA